MTYVVLDRNEQWLPIQGYPGYEVSDQGKIRSDRYCSLQGFTKIKQPIANAHGYLHIQLFKDKKPKNLTVASLVASHFKPPPSVDSKIVHKDGNKQNNRVSNLEWKPLQKNRQPKRERPKPVQLTTQQIVDEVLKNAENGKPYTTSNNLTISDTTVTIILNSAYAMQRLQVPPVF